MTFIRNQHLKATSLVKAVHVQAWHAMQGDGIAQVNCKTPLDGAVFALEPQLEGESFGLAYLVNFLGGQTLQFDLHVAIPSDMTCRFEISGYATRFQRACAVVDSSGRCIDVGDEISACEAKINDSGQLHLMLKFRSPQSASDWVYVRFSGTNSVSSAKPQILSFQVSPLDTKPHYRLYEPAREYDHATWFAVQAAVVLKNYFHFEFELHRPGAVLTGIELRSPVGVSGLRWVSNTQVQHDGRGPVPERSSASRMSSPALMERFGPQLSYAGHHLYGLLSDFVDWQYMSTIEGDKIANFVLSARFNDGIAVELPLLPAPTPTEGAIQLFKTYLDSMQAGNFVEVGGRGLNSENVRQGLPVGWKYTAIDIHAGTNVDLVGDAHHLSNFLPVQSVDVVFSNDVMEHMLTPWRFVLEANRVLKVGGFFMAVVPSAFPLHAEPWDFWRMSDHAWPAFLNQGTGFELIETGVQGSCCIVPLAISEKSKLFAQSHPAYEHTFAIARKIAEPSTDWTAYDISYAQGEYPRG